MRLEAKNITFGYSKDKKILRNVDFSVESGEIVGLSAPSGYGKSTLGRILGGFITPEAGSVELDGRALNRRGYRPVQLVFQHPEKAVDPKWTMKKILEEVWSPDEEWLKRLQISPSWLTRLPSELSGGELQRFCVLRALCPQTKFLIADEMTSMLDVITQAQLWRVVVEQSETNDLGVVVISHDEHLLRRLCRRVVRLEDINGA